MIVFVVKGVDKVEDDELIYEIAYSNGKKVAKLHNAKYDSMMASIRRKGWYSNGEVLIKRLTVK